MLKDILQCPYWDNCYRLNPKHIASYTHPNGHDPLPLAAKKHNRLQSQFQLRGQQQNSRVDSMGRSECKYGTKCYRKNPDHFKKYTHPGRP